MSFKQDDGDKDKFDESLHHYTPKKFDHSLHYYPKKIIHPEQKYQEIKTLKCDSIGFNGSTSNVRIPDSVSLSPTSAMTAMVWVNGGNGGWKSVFSHYDTVGNQRSFVMRTAPVSPYDKLSIVISDNGESAGHTKYYTSSIVAFDNNWHLIGFTFDAGTLKLFVDGVEDTNPSKSIDDAITTIHNSTVDVMLGCNLSNNTPASFFVGDSKKPLIYNRVLTDDEWMNVYVGIPISKTGLVLDMPMKNNCYGDIVKDLSGYNNHGTLTDCVWNQKWVTERKKV